MRDRDYLFSKVGWHDVERNQIHELRKAVESMDGNRLLNTSVDDLTAYFEQKFQIEIPELLTDQIVVDQRETKIDVSQDHNRRIFDRSRPIHITGTEIEVEIPFIGEAHAFQIQPTTYSMNLPCLRVRGSVIVLRIVGTDLNAEGVKTEIDHTVAEIQRNLSSLRINASGLAAQLPTQARSAIDSHTCKLAYTHIHMSSLKRASRWRVNVYKCI